MTNTRLVREWLRWGVEAVAPETVTRLALASHRGPLRLIAIGKAAPAMCRGAHQAVGEVSGICVTDHEEPVPPGVDLLLGDHPVPGDLSLAAGRRALELAPDADLALISGGGSALCEVPIDGVDIGFVAHVTERLLDFGAEIEEINLVRGHLSRVKAGGLGPLPTYLISDVGPWGQAVVSSGPTLPHHPDPERAIEVIRKVGVDMPADIERAIRARAFATRIPETVVTLADGRTAAVAVARAASGSGLHSRVSDGWLTGAVESCVAEFIENAGAGVTVAAGEPGVTVRGDGRGGRNTHAALLAAERIAGTRWVFAALATDGVDGRSGSAGAVVDGTTVRRGGDPSLTLETSDSASYLDKTGDLIPSGATGTNVADVWLVWKPDGKPQPILTS